jgi:hypothetical protein
VGSIFIRVLVLDEHDLSKIVIYILILKRDTLFILGPMDGFLKGPRRLKLDKPSVHNFVSFTLHNLCSGQTSLYKCSEDSFSRSGEPTVEVARKH